MHLFHIWCALKKKFFKRFAFWQWCFCFGLQGVVWPAMQMLWACWAPPLEAGKLAGFCYAGEIATLCWSQSVCVCVYARARGIITLGFPVISSVKQESSMFFLSKLPSIIEGLIILSFKGYYIELTYRIKSQCACVCVRVCVHMCACARARTCVCVCVRAWICVYARACVRMCMCGCVRSYVRLYVCVCTCMYVPVCLFIYVWQGHARACVCVCMRARDDNKMVNFQTGTCCRLSDRQCAHVPYRRPAV